ncbi:hypothetical protein EAH_00066770 [Eimeria acervulina]|uniref:Uncharacterized protein n=1 Tax=Eimeria acervulina TaxID=5801 RepID=U6GSI9_EIMAC|nr:hypothetical protein EAH_00066770 [Eimeria acervulina]CDI82512.1 hypothetical protein EAH_00066770 [Eimeria acervulina]
MKKLDFRISAMPSVGALKNAGMKVHYLFGVFAGDAGNGFVLLVWVAFKLLRALIAGCALLQMVNIHSTVAVMRSYDGKDNHIDSDSVEAQTGQLLLAREHTQLVKFEEVCLNSLVEMLLGFPVYHTMLRGCKTDRARMRRFSYVYQLVVMGIALFKDVRHPCDPASHRSKDLKRTRILEMVGNQQV